MGWMLQDVFGVCWVSGMLSLSSCSRSCEGPLFLGTRDPPWSSNNVLGTFPVPDSAAREPHCDAVCEARGWPVEVHKQLYVGGESLQIPHEMKPLKSLLDRHHGINGIWSSIWFSCFLPLIVTGWTKGFSLPLLFVIIVTAVTGNAPWSGHCSIAGDTHATYM